MTLYYFQEKFEMNAFQIPQNETIICLRLSRVNHSCNPNSSQTFLDEMNVKLVYSERDIKAGEEICITYNMFLGQTNF